MAFLVIGWPLMLVFYVIGDVSKSTDGALHVEPATIVILLVAHVAVVLALQALGTVRSATSWAKRQADRAATADEVALRPIPAHELADDDVAVIRAQRKRLEKWRRKESKRAAKLSQRLASSNGRGGKAATARLDDKLISSLAHGQGAAAAPATPVSGAVPAGQVGTWVLMWVPHRMCRGRS